MKRHAALQPLSRDHHVALAAAQRLRRATDLGGDYYTRRDPDRATKRLVAQLERLGHRVTLEKAAT